jgi:hypothetical protein
MARRARLAGMAWTASLALLVKMVGTVWMGWTLFRFRLS